MNLVKENGGLRNTLAMESWDKGYAACSPEQQRTIDKQVSEMGLCPECGDEPTYRTPDGTYWDGEGHYWRTDE